MYKIGLSTTTLLIILFINSCGDKDGQKEEHPFVIRCNQVHREWSDCIEDSKGSFSVLIKCLRTYLDKLRDSIDLLPEEQRKDKENEITESIENMRNRTDEFSECKSMNTASEKDLCIHKNLELILKKENCKNP